MSGLIIIKGLFEKYRIAFNTPPPVSKILFSSLTIFIDKLNLFEKDYTKIKLYIDRIRRLKHGQNLMKLSK